MPIVDGFSSTKMIRSFEKTRAQSCLSARAKHNGRIPIFAVSASLEEREREKYIATGFDGWILKPVDFKRVDQLMKGIVDNEARNECLYQSGKWEQGGWFEKRNNDTSAHQVDTTPSSGRPTAETDSQPKNSEDPTTHGESEGEITPTPTATLVKSDSV